MRHCFKEAVESRVTQLNKHKIIPDGERQKRAKTTSEKHMT